MDEVESDGESAPAGGRRATSQHIGAAGELLVQYQLLKLGIDSARMTTDSGIDLVVYAPGSREATTVQVKTHVRPRPAGGTGVLSRGWNFPQECPAQAIATVALDTDQVWLFTLAEAHNLAQQHSATGGRRLYWRLGTRPPGDRVRYEDTMSPYLLASRAQELFPDSP